jgi:tRNA pseudouridine55 synthase
MLGMDGILLIDKPKDWTSFDVVAKVRGILRASGVPKPKVGHTGTLDPLATGLVIIVIGTYCKRADEFTKLDKTYAVTAKLGEISTTGDEEGEKTTVSATEPELTEVQAAIQQFTGTLSQIPPIYSAIKVGGKRAYQLARAGKEVKIEPRSVTIHGYKDTEYKYPTLTFTVDVSSGTYIRTLVQDIGETLKTGAYTTDLRRLTVGDFTVDRAIPVDNLDAEAIYQNLQTPA